MADNAAFRADRAGRPADTFQKLPGGVFVVEVRGGESGVGDWVLPRYREIYSLRELTELISAEGARRTDELGEALAHVRFVLSLGTAATRSAVTRW